MYYITGCVIALCSDRPNQ